VTAPVNLWAQPEWAQRYLNERDAIPHRVEGLRALVEMLTAPHRVLDLGTGDGLLLALVLDAFPGATGVGLDFQPEMLRRAEARFGGDARVQLVRHDLDEALPELGTFDLVVSSFAIHHVVDERKRALSAEVFTCLDPGGMFANLEHVASPTDSLHDAFLAAIGKRPDDDDPSNKLVEVEPQLAWLREIGFVDVDCFWKWRELALLAGRRPEGLTRA
jgi:SAM-dependent methyltransferase